MKSACKETLYYSPIVKSARPGRVPFIYIFFFNGIIKYETFLYI